MTKLVHVTCGPNSYYVHPDQIIAIGPAPPYEGVGAKTGIHLRKDGLGEHFFKAILLCDESADEIARRIDGDAT